MPSVDYRVSFREQNRHLFDVTLELSGLSGRPQLLWLPAWTPGSYLVREYARHVQEVTAHGDDGQPVPVQRLGKDAWRFETTSARLTVRYRVYAFELTVRTSHLDESHAYWNGAALFLTSDELSAEPARLTVDAPPGWAVTLPLPREGERYLARDYDELVDSPFHASPTDRTVEFSAAGVPHALTVFGHGNEELPELSRDLAKIVEQAAAVFGGLPYERYLFLTLLTDRGRGGLEHKASCTLLYPRLGFRPEKARQDFLALAAHELFHAWNVKRLRPLALTPYRYREEGYTRLLWFFEGATSYYELLLLVRAGLLSPARFLEQWGERMTQLARTPGRKIQSADEASFCAWVKHYRPDENSVNSAVSYYLKGALVALSLDLELRRRGQSLDALFRRLWERYGADERGLPEDALRAEAEALAGGKLTLFDEAVHGTGDPDYAPLAAVGLRARARPRENASDKGGGRPRDGRHELSSYLGVVLKGTTIQSVLSNGPAERAGLCAEDELCAQDGLRLHPDSAQARLEGAPPGTRLRLSYFRKDELRECQPLLAERPEDTYWIDRLENASPEQRAAFEAWTGCAYARLER
ncbi:MAG: M61 family metallopeptidase [Deltaproteobacteria bacterium]